MSREVGKLPWNTPLALRLASSAATGAGAAAAYFLTSNLPYLVAALICSIAIASSATASTRVMRPLLWWGMLGAAAGCIIGTSLNLSEAFARMGMASKELWRYTAIGSISFSGLIAGIFLGRNLNRDIHVPRPKIVLQAASGLTAGIFAGIVFIKFIREGLEAAQVLSSRLSTMTTILVMSLAFPGFIGFQLGRRMESRFKRRGSR
ncbi:MAG TPA: hypothetical protein VE954_32025 [Oligoflexus sp.]|uniref:hypothetical protein n=1 Tax=Oligoflexus sp. TaxID=1971216 RepID=UPI002D617EE3|nr:hypothetical protein [Oligoflexus sp.]HYX37754.1 hypothetical protein [Oligoflexus sp.]